MPAGPAETLVRLQPHLAALGITRLATLTGLDRIGLPVAAAYRPNARSLAVSQGKGLTIAAAKVSALMESVETWHAEQVPASGSIAGVDLLSGDAVEVPADQVSLDWRLPRVSDDVATSNGLASGNTWDEAVRHALCEVIERDALAVWAAAGGESRPDCRLDLDSVHDHPCREVLGLYVRAGLHVTVWNVTSDLGVAAFRCRLTDPASSPLHLEYSAPGAGCHPARGAALLRALIEAAQVRLAYISGARDDMFRAVYRRLRSPRTPPPDAGRRCSFAAVPDVCHDNTAADVAWLLGRLRHNGVERAIAVDLSRFEIGIPVVKMIVPGLESHPFHRGYTPGERARRAAGARTGTP